jgi:hypothetical protein
MGLGGPPMGIGGPSPSLGGPPMPGQMDPSGTQAQSPTVQRIKPKDVWEVLRKSLNSKKSRQQ